MLAPVGKYGPGMEPVEMGRADCCIFCGSKDRLTDEHVIPYSIAGPWIYRRATCESCQDRFKPFESRILKRFLGPMRNKLEAPSRTPKTEPPLHTVSLTMPDGTVKQVTASIDECPVVISFPEIGPPGIGVPGAIPNEVRISGLCTAVLDPAAAEKMVRTHNATGLEGKLQFVPADWLRMIGKIGYAVACAQYGGENVLDPPILPSLLGAKDDVSQWVGSLPPEQAPDIQPGLVHHVQVQVHEGTVLAMVRLFAQLNGPAYVVVCGRVKPGFKPQPKSEFIQRKLLDKSWEPASSIGKVSVKVE